MLANRRSYRAFCAGRRKAQQTFANAPGRRHVVYTTTAADYLPLLPPGIDPRAWTQAGAATTILALARANSDGSITRCIAPLSYSDAGAIVRDLTLAEAEARGMFSQWHKLAQRGGSIVADHIQQDWNHP